MADPTGIHKPLCFECRHFRGDTLLGYGCAAFPDQIPAPILLLEHDHRTHYKGDRGIVFEPLPTTPPRL